MLNRSRPPAHRTQALRRTRPASHTHAPAEAARTLRAPAWRRPYLSPIPTTRTGRVAGHQPATLAIFDRHRIIRALRLLGHVVRGRVSGSIVRRSVFRWQECRVAFDLAVERATTMRPGKKANSNENSFFLPL